MRRPSINQSWIPAVLLDSVRQERLLHQLGELHQIGHYVAVRRTNHPRRILLEHMADRVDQTAVVRKSYPIEGQVEDHSRVFHARPERELVAEQSAFIGTIV